MGQMSAEILATFDIIFHRVWVSNIFLGGVLLIFTMIHTQIQPIGGIPLLTSYHMLLCFQMVALDNSSRVSGDVAFKRIQEIGRYTYWTFAKNLELIDEFMSLCFNNLMFVNDWDDDAILASTIQLYSKKVPAKDASKNFVDQVNRQVEECDRKG